MLEISYEIEILAPVCFAEQNSDELLCSTKKYIPGPSLRGALAAAYIKKHKLVDAHLNKAFAELFLSGKVRFLPAYPHSEEICLTSKVVPLSVMVNKDGKNIVDYSNGQSFAPGYKKMSGFAAFDNDTQKITMLNPNVQFEFHAARSTNEERIIGSSNSGKVFIYEYLEPFQIFSGSIVIDDDLDKDILTELKSFSGTVLALGRSRNAQYGTCKWQLKEKIESAETGMMADNLILYAQSAYIPEYEWNRADILAQTLADELNKTLAAKGLNARVGEAESIFASSESIGGYVGIWGVKRRSKSALSAGSLMIYKVYDMNKAAESVILERLLKGFGERIADGYGQFRLWHLLNGTWQKAIEVSCMESGLKIDAVQKDAVKILRAEIIKEIRNSAQETVSDVYNAGNIKNIYKKIQDLMETEKSKADIIAEISNKSKHYKKDLSNIYIGSKLLFDCLVEKNSDGPEYLKYAKGWSILEKMEFSREDILNLQNDLGIKDIPVSDEEVYKEFWLWFMRHLVKSLDDKNKAVNTVKKAKITVSGYKE